MSLNSLQLPLSAWLPDLPPLRNPGCLNVLNAIPENGYFRSFPSLTSISSSLTPTPETGFWAEHSSGVNITLVGTDNGLFRYDTTTNGWDDVSNGVMSSASNWRFAQFGSHVIAVAEGFAPQFYDLTGTIGSTNFANLAGSPPTASDVAVVQDFVVLARPDGENQRVQWSGFNNDTLWGVNIPNQADFQELPGRIGRVQRVVPGSYGVIICENSIYRMDYSGLPRIFTFTEIQRNKGCPAADSVCFTGNLVFYYSNEGFIAHDGQDFHPIGHDKIDNFFLNEVSSTEISTIRGAIDKSNKLVYWIYKTGAQSYYDRVLIYNWVANSWGRGEIACTGIFENITPGYNLDSLDSLFTSGIDNSGLNVDSRALSGSVLELGVFNTSRQLASFSGAPLSATFETGDFSLQDNNFIDGIRPEVEGTVTSVELGTRSILANPVVFAPAVVPNSDTGISHFRVNSRYSRVRFNTSGNFSHTYSVLVDTVRKAGKR